MNITEPLRLAVGSHEKGSGKGCAMNVISWENGDTEITDFPDCADPMLARVVQRVNDRICIHRDGDLLCPECSVIVLDLAHRTAGTGAHGLTDDALHRVWVTIAVEQAEKVLHIFESARPNDSRPRDALIAIRAWLAGGLRPGGVAAKAVEAAREARSAETTYAANAAIEAAYAANYAADAAHFASATAADVVGDELVAGAVAEAVAEAVISTTAANYAADASAVIDKFLELAPPLNEWTPALDTASAIAAMTGADGIH